MAYKFNQILVLSGLYFIISLFFSLISSGLNQLFALIFPIFLISIIGLTLFKRVFWVVSLARKVPNLVLLLNVLGAYAIIYFVVNVLEAILKYMNEQGLLTSIYAMYEEWVEPMNAVIDILFFAAFIIAPFIILIRKLKK